MTYEARRDAYLLHLRSCRACVSSFTGTKYELDNSGNRLQARYHSVSWFCDEAKRLLEAIV